MPKEKSYKTKFSSSWKEYVYKRPDGSEEQFTWIQAVFGDTSKAKCGICLGSKPFSISNGGMTQLKQHADTATHTQSRKSLSTQRAILQPSPSAAFQLSATDGPLRAEMIQALKIVESNMSFSSANGDAEKFALQFYDSDIAKNYKMEETKAKYIIQFGLYPHFKSLMLEDMKGMPFTFRFDETTTSQIKKQYDGYATYYSKKERKVITRYAGSLFVGHCKDVDLLDHFFKFMEDLNLNTDLLVSVGMDGPNVNKSFERQLMNKLENDKGNSFLSRLGFCVLHTVNNSFGEGLKELKETVDIEQLLIDLYFFFKYSAARREDYRGMESLTEVTAEYLLKYCSTRWLYIGKVIVHMMEQMDNIREYFLTYLPQQKGFLYKNGVGNTDRYKRIKKGLNNSLLLPTLGFIVYTCNIFKPFIILFQCKQPLIHVLHGRMKKLVGDLLTKFFSTKYLAKISGSDGLVKVADLNDFDVHAKKHYNAQRHVGSKMKELLENIDMLEKKKFEEGPVTSFYAACVQHLLNNLPLSNQILIDVKYLHPNMRCKAGASNSLARLTENVWKCLGSSAHEFFEVRAGTGVAELKDQVKIELTGLQLEANMPEMYKKDDATKKKQWEQPSYWKHAFALAGIEEAEPEEEYKFRNIDEFWCDVADVKDSITGAFKYPKLSKLALHCLLVLPHGNSDPERGFSINKKILEVHGSSTKEETLIALRFVKDEIILRGGIVKIQFSKELMVSCKSSRSSYMAFLEAQKLEKEMEKKHQIDGEARNEKEKEKGEKIDALKRLEGDLDLLNAGIMVAEKTVNDGNTEMGEEMSKPKVNMSKLKICQAQIAMGVKRKNELQVEVGVVKKKILEAQKELNK